MYTPQESPYAGKDEHICKGCSERQRRFMVAASCAAMKSNLLHRHGCVIVHRNEIVAEGCNTRLRGCSSVHAERDALNKLSKNAHLRRIARECEMYVVRSGDSGNLKYSKPCHGCSKSIQEMGIRVVYYSITPSTCR